MKKGDLVCGFEVLDVVPVPDCASTGIYLRHRTMGMEVFHLLNADPENLFAFAFRTPCKNSTGVAHVLEHSVLCGSEKYPLKDPFIRLANQSIKTYLNAYTASDHTAFPASSQVKADYFNLMGVYSDAVFFPLLRKEIFMQEGHRLEYDENGKPCIQGVVFNEMKGVYSSFDTAANDTIDFVMTEGTSYANDSGGDPLVIPSLTYSQFKSFHKKYYCPANCLVFLYGNIPTQEQLEFINRSVLERISSAGKKCVLPLNLKAQKVRPFVHAYGPADTDDSEEKNKDTVVLAWRLNGYKKDPLLFPMQLLFLGDLLWGDDCAPIAKALLDSGLGEDLAPQTSEDIHIPLKSMCVGLRGSSAKNAEKIKRVVMNALKELCRRGISKDDVDRTSMSFSFTTQEIRRYNGPYSLVYLRRALRGWLYGAKPWETLLNKKAIDFILKNIEENPSYIPNLIKEMLLENEECSLIVITPSLSWTKKRSQKEKALAKKLSEESSKKKIEANLLRMHRFQSSNVDSEFEKCMPHISVKELSSDFEKIYTKVSSVSGLPLFVNELETNGIVYADVAFPLDVLSPKDFVYLSTLANSLVDVGWKGCPWNEALARIHSVTGGFGAYIRHAHAPEKSLSSPDSDCVWFDRNWLVFHFKVLEQKTALAFDVLSDCISKTDFSDVERLEDVITENHNNGMSSVLPSGHVYAVMRAQCTKNRNAAITEILEGLTSLYNEKMIADLPVKKTSAKLNSMFKTIKKGGAVIHITADKSGVALVKKCLPGFIEKVSLTPPVKKLSYPDEDFYALTKIPSRYRISKKSGGENSFVRETFIIPGTVGFLGTAFDSAGFDTKHCIADEVFCHGAETQEFWQAIRTNGGAYGVMLSPDSDSGVSRFATYRDPDPFRSLESFREIIPALARKKFDADEVEKAVIGCYSVEIEPRVPSGTGATGFLWKLYGLTNAQKKRRLEWLINMKACDIHSAALRYEKSVKKACAVVLCGEPVIAAKNEKTTGIIYKLPV